MLGCAQFCAHPLSKTLALGITLACARALHALEVQPSETGRSAITTRSRRLNSAKNANTCFQGKYLRLSNFVPCAAASPDKISARAATNSPVTFPRISQGAILTRGLFRMRLTLPVSPIV